MKNKLLNIILFALLFAFISTFQATQVYAGSVSVDEALQSNSLDILAITQGGKLYDNWAKVLRSNLPEKTHPAYPSTGKKKGGTTWRCKECHGWDYKGENGAYAKGSHFTGIMGLRSMVGLKEEEIVKAIRNSTHGFTEKMLPGDAAKRLSLFVSQGQIDMDIYIDRVTKKVRGDIRRGSQFFNTLCAVCHGYDGKALNFKTPEKPEYVGTLANANPWEALHKIRNGQPGIPMIALRVLDIEDQIDILSYAQTLPTK